jgi:hypothetical protein
MGIVHDFLPAMVSVLMMMRQRQVLCKLCAHDLLLEGVFCLLVGILHDFLPATVSVRVIYAS